MKIRMVCLLCLLAVSGSAAASADVFSLYSPDQRLCVQIRSEKGVEFCLCHDGEALTGFTPIGLTLGDGTEIPSGKIRKPAAVRRQEHIEAPFYRESSFDLSYNQVRLTDAKGWALEFRAYDEGIAYRFVAPGKKGAVVRSETAGLQLLHDDTVYMAHSTNPRQPMAMAYQNYYEVTSVSKADTLLAFLPVTVSCGQGRRLTLLESEVHHYPGMFVRPDGQALKGVFSPLPDQTAYYPWRHQLHALSYGQDLARLPEGCPALPWRILVFSADDRQMPVNPLVYALSEPSALTDVSWIKPGKVAWDWWNDWGLSGVDFRAGINMDTYRHYIDFASEYHIPYVILDEGWYVPSSGDMLTSIPEIDLPELVRYGRERGVRLVLWTVFNVLDDQLEEACRKYSEMGIAGFKVDFLDRDDQTANEMVYRIAQAAARYRLFLDFHGIAKPTGINRTWPNVLNYESVFGMEEVKWTDYRDMPLYDVTFPYIRMMAGHVDYTPGAMRNASRKDFQPIYSHPMSMGTRCHQLATYIVFDSPFTMLCDAPTNYRKEPEYTRFVASLPDVYDHTEIPQGRLGEYIVTARRVGNDWYLGGLTNWDSRDLTLLFGFLEKGRSYQATLYRDGLNADKSAEDYAVETFTLGSEDTLPVHMASGGGFVLRLECQSHQ